MGPRWFVAAAAVIVLSGCGPDLGYHAVETFTSGERSELLDAAKTMEERTGGGPITILFDGDQTADRVILRAPPGGEMIGSRAGGDDWKQITIQPDLPLDVFRTVAEHELGHAYGLHHHEGAGLMNSAAEPQWTEADVEVCREAGLCR